MKNSFEASFEKRTNTDGSIDLVYKTETNWTEGARILYSLGAVVAGFMLIGAVAMLVTAVAGKSIGWLFGAARVKVVVA